MSPAIGQIDRQELLNLIRAEERATSFDRMLNSSSLYDKMKENAKKVKKIEKKVDPPKPKTSAKAKKPDINVTGKQTGSTTRFQPNGYYFSVKLDFALAAQMSGDGYTPSPALTADEKADWGTGFGNPLVNPKKNCIYVVRATIDQLRVDPMIGGFRLQWIAPSGWAIVDGKLSIINVEASSNPILIARKYRSPGTKMKNVVFRVRVLAWYP